MLEPRDVKLFSVGGVTYVTDDLARAARRWGDWAKLEDEVREGLACAARSDETGEDIDDDALDAAAQEFRYERDLISGQEMEAWLALWSIDTDDWLECLRRWLLRRRWAADLAPTLARYPVDQESLEEALPVEAVCSGFVGRVARRLAERAAATSRACEEGWLVAEPPHGDPDRALEHLDAGLRAFRDHVVTPTALSAQVAAHHLDWIRADCHCLVLPTLEIAREAALCLREDGMPLDEVARNAGVPVELARGFLDAYDAALRDPLVAARPGELLGPIPSGDRFVLALVRDKVLPALDDPAVRRRAEDRLLDRALAREVNDRVEWHRAGLAP